MQDIHAHKRGADKVCELADIYLHAVICEGNEIAPNVAVRRALDYAAAMVQARNQLMQQADAADGNGGETTREEAIASAESAQAEPVDDRDLDFSDFDDPEVETKTEPAPPPVPEQAPEKAAEGSANSVDNTPASS